MSPKRKPKETPQDKKPGKTTYRYVLHVTETVENEVTITSTRKLTYDQLEKRAEKARVDGALTCTGVSDVKIFLSEAKPGGSDALARG